jgi:hypothetical protein
MKNGTNNQKIQRELGLKFQPLEKTIKEMVESLRPALKKA